MANSTTVPSPGGDGATVDTARLAVITVLTYVFLCSVMFGIGAGIHLDDLRQVVRRRKAAIAVGLASQYLVVPAAARLASEVLRMPDADAFIIVLIGCCPGGAASNAFAYFAKADLALSVAMTAVSNALAFATLPLLLLLWTHGLEGTGTQVPFLDIFYSLLMVLVPAGLGVLLRRKRARYARRAEQCGALGGALMIVSSILVGLLSNASTLTDATLLPWKNIVVVFLVAPVGMGFALGATCLLQWCQERQLRRHRPVAGGGPDGGTDVTPVDGDGGGGAQGPVGAPLEPAVALPVKATIVLETGVQNTVLALAIAALSFADAVTPHDFVRMQLLIIMWGIVVSFEASCAMVCFRVLISRGQQSGCGSQGEGAPEGAGGDGSGD